MGKKLVIVESPAKSKTIGRYLGKDYRISASVGHIKDLPQSTLGVDVNNGFKPVYITMRGKEKVIRELKELSSDSDFVYIATDPDREGEAIAWHIANALKIDPSSSCRITFNEITKKAVTESLKNARSIDMNLVDAQQTRRILDRVVGYRISPLLWEKVKRGLSAGRVQSVALRMIGDREEEIAAFIPKEYWTLDAVLEVEGQKKPVTVHYYGKLSDQEERCVKQELEKEEDVKAVTDALEGASYEVAEVKRSERSKKSPLPFTTSTLQQEASRALNFSTQKTMRIAQQLYEGVEIKGSGTVALITYLRTDSTRVSEEAQEAAASYIIDKFGEEYLLRREKSTKNEGKIQDAHEAIRPTDLGLLPASIKDSLSRDQFRLYQLIWKRFLASRMSAARYQNMQVKITAAGSYIFTASASRLVFDGFLSVYNQEDAEEKTADLGFSLSKESRLTFKEFESKQHFTQPAPHYTEASLVKALEEQGIGRPSTYAPTITTILARHYIVKEDKNLYMTELGEVVNSMMKKAFPTIVDPDFTAQMEGLLDGVADGNVKWKTVIRNFYPDLDEAVKQAETDLEKVKIADEETDEVCENCGRKMVIKYGPHGKFLACPGFPECHNTKPYYEKIGVTCPKCGKDIVVRKTKKGRKYYGCMGNPECDYMSWQRPSDRKCPKCGGMMLIKGSKLVCENRECGYMENKPEE